jgi:hypothetical protein
MVNLESALFEVFPDSMLLPRLTPAPTCSSVTEDTLLRLA